MPFANVFGMSHLICFSVWNGRIAPVFDVSREWVLRQCGKNASGEPRPYASQALSFVQIVDELRSLGVTRLVCGAISQELRQMAEGAGVKVEGFVCGEAEEIMARCASGSYNLQSYAMPGCCKRRRPRRACKGVYL